MSKGMQRFVDNLMKGAALGQSVMGGIMDRRLKERQIEAAREAAQATAQYRNRRLGIDEYKAGAYVEQARANAQKLLAQARNYGKGAASQGDLAGFYADLGVAGTGPGTAPVEVTPPRDADNSGLIDEPASHAEDTGMARGGRVRKRVKRYQEGGEVDEISDIEAFKGEQPEGMGWTDEAGALAGQTIGRIWGPWGARIGKDVGEDVGRAGGHAIKGNWGDAALSFAGSNFRRLTSGPPKIGVMGMAAGGPVGNNGAGTSGPGSGFGDIAAPPDNAAINLRYARGGRSSERKPVPSLATPYSARFKAPSANPAVDANYDAPQRGAYSGPGRMYQDPTFGQRPSPGQVYPRVMPPDPNYDAPQRGGYPPYQSTGPDAPLRAPPYEVTGPDAPLRVPRYDPTIDEWNAMNPPGSRRPVDPNYDAPSRGWPERYEPTGPTAPLRAPQPPVPAGNPSVDPNYDAPQRGNYAGAPRSSVPPPPMGPPGRRVGAINATPPSTPYGVTPPAATAPPAVPPSAQPIYMPRPNYQPMGGTGYNAPVWGSSNDVAADYAAMMANRPRFQGGGPMRYDLRPDAVYGPPDDPTMRFVGPQGPVRPPNFWDRLLPDRDYLERQGVPTEHVPQTTRIGTVDAKTGARHVPRSTYGDQMGPGGGADVDPRYGGVAPPADAGGSPPPYVDPGAPDAQLGPPMLRRPRGGGGTQPWLPLQDQRRVAAYDYQKDFMDNWNWRNTGPGGEKAPWSLPGVQYDPTTGLNTTPGAPQQPAAQGPRTVAEPMGGHGLNPQGSQQGMSTNNAVADMMAGANRYATAVHGSDPVARIQAKDGATPQVVQQAFKLIDPDNKLPMNEKMEAATTAAYQEAMQRGDRKGADQVVYEMSKFGIDMGKQHGAAAMKALQAGNSQEAIQQLLSGYNWLPDMHTAVVQGNQIMLVDKQGQPSMVIPIEAGTIQNLALGMMSGQLGWDVIGMRSGAGAGGMPSAGQPPPAAISTAPPMAAQAPSQPSAQPQAVTAGPAAPQPAATYDRVAGSAPPPPAGAPVLQLPSLQTTSAPAPQVAQAPTGPTGAAPSPPSTATTQTTAGARGRVEGVSGKLGTEAGAVDTRPPPAVTGGAGAGADTGGAGDAGKETREARQEKITKAEKAHFDKNAYAPLPGTHRETATDPPNLRAYEDQERRALSDYEAWRMRVVDAANRHGLVKSARAEAIRQGNAVGKAKYDQEVAEIRKKRDAALAHHMKTERYDVEKELQPRKVTSREDLTDLPKAFSDRAGQKIAEIKAGPVSRDPKAKEAFEKKARDFGDTILRYAKPAADTTKGQTHEIETLNRIARNIWANNDRIDPNTAFDLALTVTSIKRPDPDGKYPTSKYNQQAGAGFTHFKPYSSSQRRHNTVLQVGPHLIQVPNDTYSDIRGLHGRNWQQYEGQKEKYDKQAEQDKLHGGTSPAKAITQGIITGLGQLPGAGPALAIGAEKVRRQFQED